MKIGAKILPFKLLEFLKFSEFQVIDDMMGSGLLCLSRDDCCLLVDCLRMRFTPCFGGLSMTLLFVVHRHHVLKYVQRQTESAQFLIRRPQLTLALATKTVDLRMGIVSKI